ncbi:MAG TPA: R3H domain-containing nucleic acid-binding protein [Patescibacteria group bacterium]|nr:R3H domain-containing nucleic acid-binding protein [Patescibacteria group bacterium]
MEEINKTIQTEAEALLDKVGIKATVKVKEDGEGFKLHLDGEENALLIGKHGNTLSSLELVLALIVAKKVGEFKRIIIEVGGYRQEREDYLRDLAGRLRQEVLESGNDKIVRGLKPWERRVIHMYLSENDDVVTESEGEDRDRILVIKKK